MKKLPDTSTQAYQKLYSDIRGMLMRYGVYKEYKDRLEEVCYVLANWKEQNKPLELFVAGLCNNSVEIKLLLDEASVLKVQHGYLIAP